MAVSWARMQVFIHCAAALEHWYERWSAGAEAQVEVAASFGRGQMLRITEAFLFFLLLFVDDLLKKRKIYFTYTKQNIIRKSQQPNDMRPSGELLRAHHSIIRQPSIWTGQGCRHQHHGPHEGALGRVDLRAH